MIFFAVNTSDVHAGGVRLLGLASHGESRAARSFQASEISCERFADPFKEFLHPLRHQLYSSRDPTTCSFSVERGELVFDGVGLLVYRKTNFEEAKFRNTDVPLCDETFLWKLAATKVRNLPRHTWSDLGHSAVCEPGDETVDGVFRICWTLGHMASYLRVYPCRKACAQERYR